MKKEFKTTLAVLLCVAMLLSALLGCSQQQKEDDEDHPHKDKVTTVDAETTSPNGSDVPKKTKLDLTSQLLEYVFFLGNGDGNGQAAFNVPDDDVGAIKFSFDDYYFVLFEPYFNSKNEMHCGYDVVYQNEIVSKVTCKLSQNINLSSGDVISVIASCSNDIFDEYELVSKEIVVPDLGAHVTQSTTLSKDVIDSVIAACSEQIDDGNHEFVAAYVIDLNPGHAKDQINSKVSDRAFALIYQITDEFLGIQSTDFCIYLISDFVYSKNPPANVIFYSSPSWNNTYYSSLNEAKSRLTDIYGTYCEISQVS